MALRRLVVAVSLCLCACTGLSHRASDNSIVDAASPRIAANSPLAQIPNAGVTPEPSGYRLLTPVDTRVVRVSDDGKRIFVQFSDALPPAGLMLFDENGKALPYTVSGNTATIDGLHTGILVRTPTHSSYAQAPRVKKAAPSIELAAARAQVLEAQARLSGLAAQVRQASKSGDSVAASRIRQELDQLDTQMAGIDATLVRARFEEGHSELVLSSESRVALIAAAKRADRVIVRGGVDAGPKEHSGARLALARAVAARRMLVEGGVAPQKVRAIYYTKVFAGPNTTPEGRALNRRVEFVLIGAGQQRVKLETDALGALDPAATKDLVIRPRSLRPVGRPAPMSTFWGVSGS